VRHEYSRLIANQEGVTVEHFQYENV